MQTLPKKYMRNIEEIQKMMRMIMWCLSLSWRGSRLYTIMRIGAELIIPFTAIFASFIGKYILNLLTDKNTTVYAQKKLLLYLILLLVISVFRLISQKVMQYCHTMHDEILGSQISIYMMEISTSVELKYYDNPKYYDILHTANRDSQALTGILWSVLTCIGTFISFFASFIILCRTNFIYGIAMLVVSIPASIAAVKYTMTLYNLSLEQINGMRQMGYYQGVAFERGYAQDIRLFEAGYFLKRNYERIWKGLFIRKRTLMKKRAILSGALECLPEVILVLIGIDISFKVMAGNATVGDYSLYTGLAGQLAMAITAFSYSAIQIFDNKLKIDKIIELEKIQNQITDTGNLTLPCVDTIEFDKVSFTYPGTKMKALSNISFILNKDQKVVFVGINGSGKSTLIKLLLRMYEPDSGMIRINGRDIREYKLTALRKNFSVYFQESQNYCFTLRDNFAISDCDRNDIDQAAKDALDSAYCEDIMKKASYNLDTNLTRLFDNDGMELSGGQHQKLALARTFFRKHSAIILDEPSSNLDPKAEHELFSSFQTLTDGKMTIYTSHRLSNTFLADRIIVIENGVIIEDGTQKDLLKNKQRFAEMFQYQQEKYIVREE